jgi:hypothetical protein
LYLTWEDAAGNGLAVTRRTVAGLGKGLSVSAQIGPVTPEQRGNRSELLFRQVSGLVPAAARSAHVLLVMQSLAGGDNDGLADNLSLVLHNS